MAQHRCQLDFLSKSDGSALYSIGNTVILASVNGPGDIKKSLRQHCKLTLEINFFPVTGQPMIKERTHETTIREIIEQMLYLHLHPYTGIFITLQEMQSDGLVLSTGINAACMALIDAGVQMKATFAAVTCCYTKDDVLIIDPSEHELKNSTTVITFVFDGKEHNVIFIQQEGKVSTEKLKSSIEQCKLIAADTFAYYRRIVEKKYSSESFKVDNT